MTKEQVVAASSLHYDELNALNKIDNFYDYEIDFMKLSGKMGERFYKKILVYFLVQERKTLTVFGRLR